MSIDDTNISGRIRERLFAMQDLQYRDFQARLVPTINEESVIGVRVPQLRKFAKELRGEDVLPFLADVPHEYYDENLLHGFLLENIKDFGECLAQTEAFLPFIDNWAVCDTFSPKVFAKHKEQLLPSLKEWIATERVYSVRFGIGMLMKHFLDEDFSPEYLELVASVKSDEYYVNMMIAWYFATALAKRYEAALPYIERGRLSDWCHNKAIQKAVESYRVSAEHKAYLKTLRKHT